MVSGNGKKLNQLQNGNIFVFALSNNMQSHQPAWHFSITFTCTHVVILQNDTRQNLLKTLYSDGIELDSWCDFLGAWCMVWSWYWSVLHLDYNRFDKYIARCFHFHRYRMPTAGKKETDTIISLSMWDIQNHRSLSFIS